MAGALTCPQWPHAPRCQDCPGGEACQEKQTARIERADAELARRRAAGEPVERWGTTAADFAGVVDQDVELTPEELAEPTAEDLGVLGDGGIGNGFRLRASESLTDERKVAMSKFAHEILVNAGFEDPKAKRCGACGSTTGAVLYERGPLAGLRRCWPCARPVLTTMEVQ